jgi:hypothetical protein
MLRQRLRQEKELWWTVEQVVQEEEQLLRRPSL